ncbi:MAG: transposase [Thaumarchaeota archaeon]|nr:transposase [Nitrososphaerota archaeon]MDE0267053.1 transposase [Nitrososphaerota archaeon]MDE0526721.1 transposase [Nitrososphaerota archaeon]
MAPDLFTFVRHPGLPPTKNMSERTRRRVVLHRKIRLMFGSITGMQTYSTLMTCMMTWDAQGKDLMGKVHGAIMAN